jgi:hypothetical protein
MSRCRCVVHETPRLALLSNAAPAFAAVRRGPLRLLLSGPKSSAGRKSRLPPQRLGERAAVGVADKNPCSGGDKGIRGDLPDPRRTTGYDHPKPRLAHNRAHADCARSGRKNALISSASCCGASSAGK